MGLLVRDWSINTVSIKPRLLATRMPGPRVQSRGGGQISPSRHARDSCRVSGTENCRGNETLEKRVSPILLAGLQRTILSPAQTATGQRRCNKPGETDDIIARASRSPSSSVQTSSRNRHTSVILDVVKQSAVFSVLVDGERYCSHGFL